MLFEPDSFLARRPVARQRGTALLVVVGLAVALSGCGRQAHPPVYPVRGQVFIDGQPAPQATVTFHPIGAKPEDVRPSSSTDEQGQFVLTSYQAKDGAPEGQYAVTVTWVRSYPDPMSGGAEATSRNFLPPRYANPTTSQLTATVTRGSNDLGPIQLYLR